MAIGQDLLNVPFPAMIRSMGLAIAEAQYELDIVSMKIARLMSGFAPEDDEEGGAPGAGHARKKGNLVQLGPDPDQDSYSLLELGFTPTFYQFVDTLIEVKISISMSQEDNRALTSRRAAANVSGKAGLFSASAKANVSSVSASYSSKYQYSAEGSSLLRTKLVTVPTPAILEERLRALATAAATPATPPS
jgi:hypothetical protein